MPRYSFLCDTCSLSFQRTLALGDHKEHPCPSCKEPATRDWQEDGFSSSFALPTQTQLGNTGVHSQDHPTADQVVGRSAYSKWDSYRDRNDVKNQAREKGKTHALIRHDAKQHTDYEPMSPKGLDAHRKLAKEAYGKAKPSSILPS